nr:MAG TPA: hypothetical protein [Caudoviricetes sp.]
MSTIVVYIGCNRVQNFHLSHFLSYIFCPHKGRSSTP